MPVGFIDPHRATHYDQTERTGKIFRDGLPSKHIQILILDAGLAQDLGKSADALVLHVPDDQPGGGLLHRTLAFGSQMKQTRVS